LFKKNGLIDITLFNKQAFPWVSSPAYFDKSVLFPKLSIVVPSYNQANYLEETLLSIIHQNYPNLELIVIDGNSTDHSIEIIKKYEQYISYWVSEQDRGQSHAINKGFERATGEWLAWMNSDDCYLEGALHQVFTKLQHESSDFIFGYCSVGGSLDTAKVYLDQLNLRNHLSDILKFFYHIKYIIPSQSVFVRRTLVEKVGLLNENFHYCMDLDWYARMYLANARILECPIIYSFFRINLETKTGSQYLKMQKEAIEIAEKYAINLSLRNKNNLKRLIRYHVNFIMNNDYNTNKKWLKLWHVFFNSPVLAVNDTRFWGSFKKLIYEKIGI